MPKAADFVSVLPQAAGLRVQLENVWKEALETHQHGTRRMLRGEDPINLAGTEHAERAQLISERLEEVLAKLGARRAESQERGADLTPDCVSAIERAEAFLGLGGSQVAYASALRIITELEEYDELEELRAQYGDDPLPTDHARALVAREFGMLESLDNISTKLKGAEALNRFNRFYLEDEARELCEQVRHFLEDSEGNPLIIAEREKLKLQVRLDDLGKCVSVLLLLAMNEMTPRYEVDSKAVNLGFDSLDGVGHALMRRSDEIHARAHWEQPKEGPLALVFTLRQGNSIWTGGKNDLNNFALALSLNLQGKLAEIGEIAELLRGDVSLNPAGGNLSMAQIALAVPFKCEASDLALAPLAGGKSGLLFTRRS